MNLRRRSIVLFARLGAFLLRLFLPRIQALPTAPGQFLTGTVPHKSAESSHIIAHLHDGNCLLLLSASSLRGKELAFS